MMRRRTYTASMLLGLLTACSKTKPPIIGDQMPVMPASNPLDVAVDAPAVSLPAPMALDGWTQSFGNAAHAPGNVAAPLGFAKRFTVNVGAEGGYRQPLTAQPLIAGDRIFVFDADAAVHAVSAADGSRLWTTRTRPAHVTAQNLGGGIAYAGGTLYASTGFGEVLAFDPASGKILWRQPLDYPARTAPMVAGGLVAVIDLNDLLQTFDAASGTPGWRFSGSVGTPSTAAVANSGAPAYAEGMVVGGFSNGLLAAIDAASGTPAWEQSLDTGGSGLDFSDIVAAPVIAGGVVYAINLGGTFMAVDLHSGNKVWTHSAHGGQTPASAGGFLFLLDSRQTLFAIHEDDGLVSWKLELPRYKKPATQKGPIVWAGPVLLNGALVVVNDQGEAALIDPVAGQVTRTAKLDGPADFIPVAANGLLAVLTRNAELAVYS
ncbi:PQQ-binding-like beta-propeller repeat protein [Acidocella sp.]|uniref:outer membrane protein assembly factor BamB family protein n=1 Tax=Acidocella sp. TaxID=50710 RepID=UPI0026303B50|nr:PQQ-binding-like beta-propeller repeat protein [Acidocella sp.]